MKNKQLLKICDGDYTKQEEEIFNNILYNEIIIDWFENFEKNLNKEYKDIYSNIEYLFEGKNLEVFFLCGLEYNPETEEDIGEKKEIRFYIEDIEILNLLRNDKIKSEENCYFGFDFDFLKV